MATSHISSAAHAPVQSSTPYSPKLEADLRLSRKYTAKPNPLPSSSLLEAGLLWLKRKKEENKPRTIANVEIYLNTLVRFFGDIPLADSTLVTLNTSRPHELRRLRPAASTRN